jgi:arylsulfatase A-like enzyme
MIKHRNLILVTVDAWRSDFAHTHAGIPLLPILDELSAHTIHLDRFYTHTPWTTPAVVSLLTGESPAKHGVIFPWSEPRTDAPSLSARLQGEGYAVPNICYLTGIQGYQNLGFDPREAPDRLALRDEVLVETLRHLRGNREPFFLWYHYKHVHLPYWASVESRRRMGIDDDGIPQCLRDSVCSQFMVPRERYRLLGEDRAIIQRLYAAGVLDLNEFLRPLVEELLRGDLLERTTFALVADHGEELMDHGHAGHASTSFHATLHEEVLRVPLFITDGRILEHACSHARLQGMDLLPLLLSLVGVESSRSAAEEDFADDFERVPPCRNFHFHSVRMGFQTPREKADQWVEGFSDGRQKFISEQYERPRYFVYDLQADPEEQHPRLLQTVLERQPYLQRLASLRDELSR